MMGRRLALALTALLIGGGLATAATAQTTDSLDRWNSGAVTEALQSLGAAGVTPVSSEGRAAITARTHEGLNVGVYAKACDPGPPGVEPVCHALEAIISFDPGARADRKALADQLNHRYALGKFMDEPDGSIRVSRYIVFDGGVTQANLRAQFSSLFAIANLTAQTLWPDTARR